MTYHYAELGPEKFQYFCQALISAEFPNAQCLVVGQPDGGRDAYLRYAVRIQGGSRRSEDRIVFQVKFTREPHETDDPFALLKEVVKREKKKVERLIARGAKRYYLLTNFSGTSHLEGGSVDKLNQWLTQQFGIDSYCWWRNDLDRRLDAHSDIKWSYPELLRATDLLQALFEGQLGETEQQRRSAISAYLASQYADDEELKFKQVELQSDLMALFVDLPMSFAFNEAPTPRWSGARGYYYHRNEALVRHQFPHRDDECIPAALFLLSPSGLRFPQVLIEGAPGQGKSTITQYVCQVLRTHVLGHEYSVSRLPQPFRNILLRIPFRLDLRDVAKWMSGRNPFSPKSPKLPADEPRSLEAFIAAQVRHESGGHSFNVSDLSAVVRNSHVLLALDGFDEVADIELRNALVQEIGRATKRLQSLGGHSIQIIVTSRPAAFAKSQGFPYSEWSYFQLKSLGQDEVDAYTEKWMTARGLKEAEQTALRSVLSAKLQESHTQSLARNPMQLTILLTLVHQRGPSLPEKRTSLYSSYMDLFFTREAEKSEVVKTYRDLLEDVHGYLAWHLQTAAEKGESGSIEYEKIRTLLTEYLESQGEDTVIVPELFDGVLERVGALVSRVPGTYEFEVQPLREYFAARHLYMTAPYSPPGSERTGTKLDIFDALSRNPYWLNVTRFYGGFFSKGEVSALVDALEMVDRTADYSGTSHAQRLGLMLLSDWVFSQYQPAIRRIMNLIVRRPQVRILLASTHAGTADPWAVLPDRCGRADLLEALAERARDVGFEDEIDTIGGITRSHLDIASRVEIWEKYFGGSGHEVKAHVASAMDLFTETPDDQVCRWAKEDNAYIPHIITAWRFRALSMAGLEKVAEDILLSGRFKVRMGSEIADRTHRLTALADAFSVYKLAAVFGEDTNRTLRDAIPYRVRSYGYYSPEYTAKVWDSFRRSPHSAIAEGYTQLLSTPVAELATSLAPWDQFVESCRAEWGEQNVFRHIAIIASAARAGPAGGLPAQLFDQSVSLVARVRAARLKSGAPRWWRESLRNAPTKADRTFALLVIWTWATSRTLLSLREQISAELEELTEKEWADLVFEHEKVMSALGPVGNVIELSSAVIAGLQGSTARYLAYLGRRASIQSRSGILAVLPSIAESDLTTSRLIAAAALDLASESQDWSEAFRLLSRLPIVEPRNRHPRFPLPPIDPQAARSVLSEPEKHLLTLVAEADKSRLAEAGEAAESLSSIAERDRWFITVH